MDSNLKYWRDLTSLALRLLQEQGNSQAAFVIKNSTLRVELNEHDNWNGGIDYWDIIFELKYRDYKTILKQKNEIEAELDKTLSEFHSDGRDLIANVLIRPIIERLIDWRAVLPETKESVIQLIKDEQTLLTEIATGKSYKDPGVEESYQERHQHIVHISTKAGFEYPVTANSLAEWWIYIRETGGYSERRAHISQLFAPVLKLLNESDDSANVDFSRIASRSGTVKKAIDDADVFIREGKYDSAVDRVHTAFHGYLRKLLNEHGESNTADDSLPGLFARLHIYYGSAIQPADVGERVKLILRSAGGMVTAVNELRNNNTVAHPNGNLIQKREAQLVIRLVNAIIDYIEDIEKSISQSVSP